ncbi:hypothetical protein IMSHALPRED_004389 [Imshaugia aleurites]|uniref:Uncharacterized protein n=1 Tax=Imshaugia aleurites TaxID=172621 RepID=A0A8H3FD98_9LECA|nr:hypothetical protein IMSHALPRED_004389 [Imshaugia aleurites]
MASEAPRIEIRLQANRVLYLSRETRFSLVILITLNSQKPVTFVKVGNELGMGLVNQLITQSVECVDAESEEAVPVLAEPNCNESKEECPPLMTIYDRRSDYLTFTTASTPREYEFIFETNKLQSDRIYTVICHPLTLRWWSYDSREDILSYYASHGELPPSETPPLPCSATRHEISFSTCQDLPQSPAITVSLSAPSTFSLSNNPPFRFTTTFTSHAPQPITALAEREDIKTSNKDVEVLSSETRLPIDSDLIDDGNMSGPWRREDFLRMEPEVPYVESRVLDPTKAYSGFENLRVGEEYVLRMPNSQWPWWSEDSVDEVMSYAGDRDSGQLGHMPSIELICHDEVRFRAVK